MQWTIGVFTCILILATTLLLVLYDDVEVEPAT